MGSFEEELYQTHFQFFHDYFTEEEKLDTFIRRKLEYHETNIPRRMINNIQRLCTLSDDMDLIKPGYRDLSVFFILTCIEALFTLANRPIQKQQMVIDFYQNFLSSEDKAKIHSKIMIMSVDRNPRFLEKITIEQFALLLCAIRNNVAHEGYYWSFHFQGETDNSNMINVLNSKLVKDAGYNEVVYEVGLKYSEFKQMTIRGFINLADEYFNNNCIALGSDLHRITEGSQNLV